MGATTRAKRQSLIHTVRWTGLLAVLAIISSLLAAIPASADTGTVTVSATAAAKMSITIADNTADFGTNIDPSGTASNSGDTVTSVQGSTGNQGSYYIWKSAGSGNAITVKSNKAWTGTVAASANGGTATSMTIASGVLRYGTSVPATYGDAAAMTALTTGGAAWGTNPHSAGTESNTYYYVLRLDWNDDTGTFSSTVTYTATQS